MAQTVSDTSISQVSSDSAVAKQNAIQPSHKDDSVVYNLFENEPNPKKAGLYSALLPGVGQLYNQQYWKIPLIYAGAGVAVYFFVNNQKNYRKYRQAYISRIDTDTNNDLEPNYTAAQLKTLQDQYKKWLDMTSLLTAVGYTLQVLDAVVFCHLKEFDISRDISLRMQPVNTMNNGVGFGLAMHFK